MDFPYWAVLLASRQGLCDLSRWQHFRILVVPHLVVSIQSQRLVQPLPTPSVPAETLALPCTHQVSPYLLLDPVFHVSKAPTGVTCTDPLELDNYDSLFNDNYNYPLMTIRNAH